MTGVAFERETATALKALGWDVQRVGGSGDFGADVIARFGTSSIVVQCKDWQGAVRFDAVKEVVFARLHYRADIAVVVSRSGFTKQARRAAESAGVKLLRLSDLARGCEFDRSAEWARIKREREALERARRARAEAVERARQERERAEEQALREREAAAARARAEAERQAREKSDRERREAEARAAAERHLRDLAAYKWKAAFYDHRWAVFAATAVAVALAVASSSARSNTAVLSLAATCLGVLGFFVGGANEPLPPRMPNSPDVPGRARSPSVWDASSVGRAAGGLGASRSAAAATAADTAKATRWCPGCVTGLRLPTGRRGYVRCPACGERFEACT